MPPPMEHLAPPAASPAATAVAMRRAATQSPVSEISVRYAAAVMKVHAALFWTLAACFLLAYRTPAAHSQDVTESTQRNITTEEKDEDVNATNIQSQSDADECHVAQEVVDPCPELSVNHSTSARQLEGAWQVIFGYARALTARALCPRMAFAREKGPCMRFSWGPAPRGGARGERGNLAEGQGGPLPAPGPLRIAPPVLLAPPAQGEPVLKVLGVQEPFASVAVCSAEGPRRILGLSRVEALPASAASAVAAAASSLSAGDGAAPAGPGAAAAAALDFWASVHAPLQRAGGPAWYLCARAWEEGPAADSVALTDADGSAPQQADGGQGADTSADADADERAFHFADGPRR